MRDVFRNMDLNLLRVFAALMAEGNVTRAADRLALTQPAASNALTRLRETFDDPLFEKVQFGVRPTPRARELWALLQPHFDAMREAISPARFDPMRFEGTFTVAMSDYTVERVMPRLSHHLGLQAPGMRLSLAGYVINDLSEAFVREAWDLAIGAHLDDGSQTSGLRSHHLWPVESSCLMRRDHPLARGELTLEAFLAARHVDVRLSGANQPLYDNLLAAHGLRRNLVFTLAHYSQTLAILASSDCIGVLPTSLLDLSPYAGQLLSRAAPIAMPMRPLAMIWHQRRDADPAHGWLRQLIIELFGEGTAPGGVPRSRRRASARPSDEG